MSIQQLAIFIKIIIFFDFYNFFFHLNNPLKRIFERKREKSRQLPTFPGRPSIIGVRELDFRVRNGNGYCLSTMATGIINTSYTARTPSARAGTSFGIPAPAHESGAKGPCSLIRPGFRAGTEQREERNRELLIHGNDNMVKPHDLLVLLG